ncbi:MAG TPA: HAD-IIA family hydrolase [Kofleriaceae bacterium]|nr:HAD-IIA family hydrolase [Kofleriaceae bacterium]
MAEPRTIEISELLDQHRGVLLDVYGVLFDARGPLPGAADLIAELERRGTPYRIVTNDASRSQATYAARFARHGIAVAPERFVTSGSLLPDYFREHRLAGARTLVLGTADSIDFVREGGGVPVSFSRDSACFTNELIEAVAVCDDDGFDFLQGLELALSSIVRAVDAGYPPALILPNPDLVYPKGGGELGFTAGAIALLLEAALARRFPGHALRFVHLGKPEPHLFVAAAHQLGVAPHELVMIGDQLETDIAGARAAGCACALLAGVSSWHHARATAAVVPDYLLDKL